MAGQPNVVRSGNVAVVTGAASGIGFAMAQRFARASMAVVLADVEAGPLYAAEALLRQDGHDVMSYVTDVSDPDQTDALRDAALARFGAVHLLCNNAGVGSSGEPIWSMPKAEWDWVFGVNVDGVLNGIRSFVPTLLDQPEGYVVNTSSSFGLFAGCRGPYGVSKHAVVALSETLHFQLAASHPNVGVSVLCPGAVRTNIVSSDRNRPDAGATGGAQQQLDSPEIAAVNKMIESGMDPAQVADLVVRAIGSGRFYVLTHDNRDDAISRRSTEILAGGPPAHPLA